MELKEIFAKNLTALRLRSKMTQLELGNVLNYSDKAVSKWERGEAIPDAYVLLQLSEIFGVSVDYLLKEHVKPPPAVTKVNHTSIVLITVIAVFTLFAAAFIIMYLAGFTYPLIFCYAVVISLILLTVFSTVWAKRRYNLPIISALVISIIVTLYLIFLSVGFNFWQLLLLAIPAELIVVLCFKVKVSYFFTGDSKKAKNKNDAEK